MSDHSYDRAFAKARAAGRGATTTWMVLAAVAGGACGAIFGKSILD